MWHHNNDTVIQVHPLEVLMETVLLSPSGSDHHIPLPVVVPFDTMSTASFVLGIVLALLSLIGLFGSMVTCYIFTRPEMRQTSINFLLTGLSIFDGSVALFGGSVFATVALCAPFPESMDCNTVMTYSTVLIYPLAMTAQTASIWTLIVITFERFVAVCFPLHAKSYCTVKRAKGALLLIAATSFAFNVIRYFEYQLDTSVDGQILQPVLKNNDAYLIYYMLWLNLITHYIVPTAALVSVNSYIIYLLKRTGAAKDTVVAERRESCLTLTDRKTSQTLRRFSNHNNSYESRTTWMMLTVIALFLLCNTSSFILNAVEAQGHENTVYARLFWVLSDLNNMLVMFNSSVNCFIYYRFSVKYRKHCCQLVSCYFPDAQLATYGELLSSVQQVTRNASIVVGYTPERMDSICSQTRLQGGTSSRARRGSSVYHNSITRIDS